MRYIICFFALIFCYTAIGQSCKRDHLQKVKVIRLGSLFGTHIASFHCDDFFEGSGHYQHIITDSVLLRMLERYKLSATRKIPKEYQYALTHRDVADGKLFFFYKSGKVDSMCFDGDYLLLNDVPMAVPKDSYYKLYYLLDSL